MSMVAMNDVLPGMEDYGYVKEPTGNDFLDNLQTRVQMMISDARDYNDTELAPAREKADLYFRGDEPALLDEGRSTIVATEVKDVIMGIMPSLMRIFTATEPVCNFVATSEKNVDQARQATEYITYVMMQRCDGYRMLYGALMDGLRKATGVVGWYTDTSEQVIAREYEGVTELQVRHFLSMNKAAQLVGAEPASQPGLFNIKVTINTTRPQLKVFNVPPEELRIDRLATCTADAQLLGRERTMRKAELVKLGYPEALVEQFVGSGDHYQWSMERQFRQPGTVGSGMNSDPDADLVNYGEYYILIDADGDGIEELNRVCVMGDDDTIVMIEPAERRKYALFCPDLEPHAAIGHSVSEYCYDLQRIKTNLMRNTLDSLAQTIYPRQVVNERMTNIDDVLNTELGAPIRTTGPVQEAVMQLQASFNGEQVMPVITYLDQVRQLRTGVSEASKGVDPRALQSTTVKGVDMLISGAQERIELIARTFAETGLKDVFTGMLAEVCDNPPIEDIIQVRGKYIPVDPSQFDPSLPCQVNPNIGKGSDADRMIMLTQVKATQEMIIQQMGPENPLVTPVEYRNTLDDLLSLANIKDVGRYFKPITVQDVQAALKAKQQSALQQPNPALILANAEVEKTRASTAKAVADNNYRMEKLRRDDDFRHLKLQGDMERALLDALGQHGIQPQHDMAKHLMSTAKDLLIAQQDREDRESAASGDAADASSTGGSDD
jgi:hypothetical protein